MNIKSQFGKSTAWMSLAASGNSVISFVIFIVLSRLLNPEEIGLVAFALIIIELGKIVVNGGFAQAVIQKEVWDHTYASTCFYLNLLFSFAVALSVVFIVVPLVEHYYQPEAGPILKVLSITFFLEGAKAVHEGKLKREFAFKVIAIRTILAGFIPGAVGIFLAFKGYGVWSLVAQQLLNQIVVTVLTILTAKWMPGFIYSVPFARQILSFSSPLMIAQLISNFSAKIFEIVIGISIGPAALGFYRVGGRALFILQDIVLKPFEYTALSALSRVNTTENQISATLRMVQMSAFIIFPLFFGAAAIAQEFIIFAFGEKWRMSGEIMTILAFGIAPLVVGIHANALLTASGNSKKVMTIAAVSFGINCALCLICVPYGIIFAAWAFALKGYLINCMSLFWLKKAFNLPLKTIPKILMPSFLSSLFMFFLLKFIGSYLSQYLPTLVVIMILGIIGALIYMLIMALVFRMATRLILTEAAGLAPAKFLPYLISLKKLMKLH